MGCGASVLEPKDPLRVQLSGHEAAPRTAPLRDPGCEATREERWAGLCYRSLLPG